MLARYRSLSSLGRFIETIAYEMNIASSLDCWARRRSTFATNARLVSRLLASFHPLKDRGDRTSESCKGYEHLDRKIGPRCHVAISYSLRPIEYYGSVVV
jgi:hypothetical protein